MAAKPPPRAPPASVSVLARELPLLLRALVRERGYASFDALACALNDAPPGSDLRLALSACGHRYPFRSLPLVEGLFVVQRELLLQAQLCMTTALTVSRSDLEGRVLASLRRQAVRAGVPPPSARRFADLGVGDVLYAPGMDALLRIPPYAGPGAEPPTWVSLESVLSTLASDGRLEDWAAVFDAAAVASGARSGADAVRPRRLPSAGFLTVVRNQVLIAQRATESAQKKGVSMAAQAAVKSSASAPALLKGGAATTAVPLKGGKAGKTAKKAEKAAQKAAQKAAENAGSNAARPSGTVSDEEGDSSGSASEVVEEEGGEGEGDDATAAGAGNPPPLSGGPVAQALQARQEPPEPPALPQPPATACLPSFHREAVGVLDAHLRGGRGVRPTALVTAIASLFQVREAGDVVPALRNKESTLQWAQQEAGGVDASVLAPAVAVTAPPVTGASTAAALLLPLPPVAALAAVPLLSDAGVWTAWDDTFCPAHGVLSVFLREEGVCEELEAAGVRFVEGPRGVFVRVASPEAATARGLLDAAAALDPVSVAACLASMAAFHGVSLGAAVEWTGVLGGVLLPPGGGGSGQGEEEEDDPSACPLPDAHDTSRCTALLIRTAGFLPPSLRGVVGAAVLLPLLVDGFGLSVGQVEAAVAGCAGEDAPCQPVQAFLAAAGHTLTHSAGIAATGSGRAFARDLLMCLGRGTVVPALTHVTAAKAAPAPSPHIVTQGEGAEGEATPVVPQSSSPPPSESPSYTPSNTTGYSLEGGAADSERPTSLPSARLIVERMRSMWLDGDSSMTRDVAVKATSRLAGDLYKDATHFLFEMLQNADDNDPGAGLPALAFDFDVRGDDDATLTVRNNEAGFRARDVQALCLTGGSTKTTAGYIGKKGIGWKAVFAVSSRPEVHSGYVHFALDARPVGEGGLGPVGQLAPTWLEPVLGSGEREQGESDGYTVGTVFVLPLAPSAQSRHGTGGDSALTSSTLIRPRKLEDGLWALTSTPAILLFMRRLRRLGVSVSRAGAAPERRTLTRMPDVPVPLPETLSAGGHRACIATVLVETGGGVVRHRWLLHALSVPLSAAPPRSVPAATTASHTELALAFPLARGGGQGGEGGGAGEGQALWAAEDDPTPPTQLLFSFLPVDDYGLPFVLQADWILPSTRESVRADNPFNEWLAHDVLPAAFAAAHEVMRAAAGRGGATLAATAAAELDAAHALLRHLPGRDTLVRGGGFFAPAVRGIVERVRGLACLPPVGGGPLVTPSSAVRTSKHRGGGYVGPCGETTLLDDLAQCGLDPVAVAASLGVSLLDPCARLPQPALDALKVRTWSVTMTVQALAGAAPGPIPSSDGSSSPAVAERFVSWCRLLWRSVRGEAGGGVGGEGRLLHLIAATSAQWVPTSDGRLTALDAAAPIVFCEERSHVTLLGRLNKHGAWLPCLHPSVVALFPREPFLRRILAALGIVPFDLRAVVASTVLRVFDADGQRQGAKESAAPSQPSVEQRDTLLAASAIVSQWVSADHSRSGGAANADDAHLLDALRKSAVLLTSDGCLARLITDEEGANGGGIPRVSLHLHSSLLPPERRGTAEALESTLGKMGLWRTPSPAYVAETTGPRAAGSASITEWTLFFTALGVTECFTDLPTRSRERQHGLQSAVLALVPSAVRARAQAAPGTAEEAHAGSSLLVPELAAALDVLVTAARCPSEQCPTPLVRSGLLAVHNHLRAHLDVECASGRAVAAWLRALRWIPVLPRKQLTPVEAGGPALQLLPPASLLDRCMEHVCGNYAEYEDDEGEGHDDDNSHAHHRGAASVQRDNSRSTRDVDAALGIATSLSSERRVALLRALADDAAAVPSGQIVVLSPHALAARTALHPSPLAQQAADRAALPPVSPALATVMVHGPMLGELYALVSVEDAEAASSALFIPCAPEREGGGRAGHAAGTLLGRFAPLSAGHVVHDDGAGGMMWAADVWSAWSTGNRAVGRSPGEHVDASDPGRVYRGSTPMYDHIRAWSHAPCSGGGGVEKNEAVAWRWGLLRVQAWARAAAAAGDGDGVTAAATLALCVSGSSIERQRGTGGDKSASSAPVCFKHTRGAGPSVRPLLLPVTRLSQGGRGGVRPAPPLTHDASSALVTTPAQPLVELLLVSGAQPVDEDGLPAPRPIYVLNDDAERAATVAAHYSSGRGQPILLITCEPALSDGAHAPSYDARVAASVTASLRDFLLHDTTVAALSLRGPLMELPPLPSGVSRLTPSPAHKHAWAHACRAVQLSFAKFDSYLYSLVQSAGTLGAALRAPMQEDDRFATTPRLEVAHALQRREASGRRVPFVVSTTPCAARLIQDAPDAPWRLYVQHTDLPTPSLWCSAAVDAVFAAVRRLTEAADDAHRVRRLERALCESLAALFPPPPLPMAPARSLPPEGDTWYVPEHLRAPTEEATAAAALVALEEGRRKTALAALEGAEAEEAVAAVAVLTALAAVRSSAADVGRYDLAGGDRPEAGESSEGVVPGDDESDASALERAVDAITDAGEAAQMLQSDVYALAVANGWASVEGGAALGLRHGLGFGAPQERSGRVGGAGAGLPMPPGAFAALYGASDIFLSPSDGVGGGARGVSGLGGGLGGGLSGMSGGLTGAGGYPPSLESSRTSMPLDGHTGDTGALRDALLAVREQYGAGAGAGSAFPGSGPLLQGGKPPVRADLADPFDLLSGRAAPAPLDDGDATVLSHVSPKVTPGVQPRAGPEPTLTDVPLLDPDLAAMFLAEEEAVEGFGGGGGGAEEEEDETHGGMPNTATPLSVATGRAAERIVHSALVAECGRLQASSASAAAPGAPVPLFEVEWVNASTESGAPYDLLVRRRWVHRSGGADAGAASSAGDSAAVVVRHVEVKGTRAAPPLPGGRGLSLLVSPAEMAWAHAHASTYELWVVAGLGSPTPRITRVRNPMACINVAPPRLSLVLELRGGVVTGAGGASTPQAVVPLTAKGSSGAPPLAHKAGGGARVQEPSHKATGGAKAVSSAVAAPVVSTQPAAPTAAADFVAFIQALFAKADGEPVSATEIGQGMPQSLRTPKGIKAAVFRAVPHAVEHGAGTPHVSYTLSKAKAVSAVPTVAVHAASVKVKAQSKAAAAPLPVPAPAPVRPGPSPAPATFESYMKSLFAELNGKPVSATEIGLMIPPSARPTKSIQAAVMHAFPRAVVHGAGTPHVSFSLSAVVERVDASPAVAVPRLAPIPAQVKAQGKGAVGPAVAPPPAVPATFESIVEALFAAAQGRPVRASTIGQSVPSALRPTGGIQAGVVAAFPTAVVHVVRSADGAVVSFSMPAAPAPPLAMPAAHRQ